jgi:hypothetical protein
MFSFDMPAFSLFDVSAACILELGLEKNTASNKRHEKKIFVIFMNISK